MILVTVADRDGQPLRWVDTDTRIVFDKTSGRMVSRPMTAQENAACDVILEAQAKAAAAQTLRDQLASGVQDIANARDAANEDVPVAEGLQATALAAQTAALSQKALVAAWNPAATYQASDLAAIRGQLVTVIDRQAAILGALAGGFAYRAAVDRNAVTTDDALLWLATLVARLFDDPEGI